jgi:hypothetical protein
MTSIVSNFISSAFSTRESVRLVPKGCRDRIRGERDPSTHKPFSDLFFAYLQGLTSRTSSSILTKSLSGTLTSSNGFPLKVLSKSPPSVLHQSKGERRTMKRRFTLLRHHTVAMILSMYIPEKSRKHSGVSTDVCRMIRAQWYWV